MSDHINLTGAEICPVPGGVAVSLPVYVGVVMAIGSSLEDAIEKANQLREKRENFTLQAINVHSMNLRGGRD